VQLWNTWLKKAEQRALLNLKEIEELIVCVRRQNRLELA
jgi:hypothetical protein